VGNSLDKRQPLVVVVVIVQMIENLNNLAFLELVNERKKGGMSILSGSRA